ncbi:MAG: DUF6569 family protein [Gemmatales bacterium]|nr:hypothetical protein [Gemmatales bacterium]MDW7995192.1 DUF6569 family protein [Gemmatales bacterium]
MHPLRINSTALLACFLLLTGCSRSQPDGQNNSSQATSQATTVEIQSAQYRVTGPYVHKNLAVFFLHTAQQDPREFLTLDEGLNRGLVKVSERPDARVNELIIENNSDLPLFLQEVDRLYGGQQDRILYASLIIPPKSGPTPIPAYCIEPGRWSPGAHGMEFRATKNPALAPLAVRNAAKLNKSQAQVWAEVQGARTFFFGLAGESKLQSTSLNEVLESPEVTKLCQQYADQLVPILSEHPDAVGVVIAINGEIVEANIYPNHRLLSRMYARLIQSHVLDAVARKDQAQDAETLTADDVITFLTTGTAQHRRSERINNDNRIEVVELQTANKPVNMAECATFYRGQQVHLQRVTVTNPPRPSATRAQLSREQTPDLVPDPLGQLFPGQTEKPPEKPR